MKLNTTTAILLLFILPFGFFFPYIFQSPQPLILPNSNLGTDLTREILPTAIFIQEELSQWHSIPLWRPYILSGAPLAGHPVYPLLYPFFWIISFLPVSLALNLLVVLHLGLAAAGSFLFLKQIKELSGLAAFAGAMIFGYSPKIIAYVSGGHWTMTMAIAWLPWIWLIFYKYWQTEKWKWILLLGLCFSMQISTDLRTFYITLIPLVVLSIAFIKKPLIHWLKKTFKMLVGASILASCLSAGQILPFLELLSQSSRTILPFKEASFGSLHPVLLISMLFPPQLKIPEYYIYMGVSALVFGFLAIVNASRKDIKIYIYLLLAAIILSLGSYTPVYKVLYTIIPGISFLRVPARWWIVVVFLLSILVGMGIDNWIIHWNEIRKKSTPILIMLGIIYLAGLIIWVLFPKNMPFSPIVPCIELGAICILLFGRRWFSKINPVAVVFLFGLWFPSISLLLPLSQETVLNKNSQITDILENGARNGERSFTPYSYNSISQAFHPELLAADGYDSFHVNTYQNFVEKMIGCSYPGYSVSVPALLTSPEAAKTCPVVSLNPKLAKLLNIRYLLLPDDHPIDQGTIIASEIGLNLIDLEQGYGQAFGVHDVKVVDSNQCLDELDLINPQKTALIETPITLNGGDETIQIINQKQTSNGMEFNVSSKEPFLLIRSETWAPGWQAFDELGGKLEVLRVDCTLQGVFVEAGDHTILFEYRPKLLVIGVIISAIFSLGMVTFAVIWLFRKCLLLR